MARIAGLVGALSVGIVLIAWSPAPAAAEYFFTERGAEKVTKDAVKKRYGFSRYETGVFCRPQGEARAATAYKYHRWVCTWAVRAKGRCEDEEESIFGQMLIVGHSGRGSYGYRVQRGAYCETI